jgi:hypothetical protein
MNRKPKIVFLPHGNLQYSQLRPEHRGWVVENCYEKLFDLVDRKGCRIGFEASGFTVDAIAALNSRVMSKLKGLVANGQIEPVASPHIHIMLSNIDPLIGLQTLKDGREAWERHTGVCPSVGWNPECSWADYIPEAGYPLNASRLYRLCFPPTMCRYVAGVAAADCSMRR